MSFSVSEDAGAFEWGSATFRAFFGKISNLFRPWFWRLIFDIIRFNYFATDILSQSSDTGGVDLPDTFNDDKDHDSERHYRDRELEPIGKYLDRQGYSDQFKRYFIIPMVAAPWCIDPEEFANNFPAISLIRFMYVDSKVFDLFTGFRLLNDK